MPRTVRTARGEMIDFDAIVIKQQIAAAPMNIDVARRKEFIDSKEGKVRGARKPTFIDGASEGAPDPNAFVTGEATRQVVINDAVSVKAPAPAPAPAPVAAAPAPAAPAKAADFEIEGGDAPIAKGPVEAVPIIPERKK